jgi:ubiquinone biosynthesis protein COQ9
VIDAEALTLPELRLALAPALAEAAMFDGWSAAAVAHAAEVEGVDPAIAALAFVDGAMAIDAAMEREFADGALAGQPVRERIRRLIAFRLEALAGREEALQRALAIMAMPHNAARSLRMGWASADAMWRLAGDAATDFNHYTKRAILAGIYTATLAVFAQDESDGKAETHAFLARRIEGVMRFEKAKAGLLRDPDERFSLVRFLGRMRYPAT